MFISVIEMQPVEKIKIPQGVDVQITPTEIIVSGSGKKNVRPFRDSDVYLKKTDSEIEVYAKKQKRNVLAQAKTMASHIKNLIAGLSTVYEYKLEIVYSHFPLNVTIKGDRVEIYNLAGAKHPRKARIIGDTKIEVKGKDITVRGQNKEHVGQSAANLEQVTRVKGKDIRIFQDRIYIVSKAKKVI
ncbi:MAG TPA: 50S ribosomal protein L6 [archaeon]|nr:50S ribosomal protein L6 [archaeon]